MPESFLLLSIEKSLLLNILYAIIKAVGNDKKLTIPSKPSKFAVFNEYGGENMAKKSFGRCMPYSHRYNGRGLKHELPAAELGAIVIKEALNRAGVAPEAVDQVYMGCVIQAGLGQNVARQASIKAGLPIEVPAVTMNVVCGSGLNCVNQAAQMILAGDADIVVAGGMETCPWLLMQSLRDVTDIEWATQLWLILW